MQEGPHPVVYFYAGNEPSGTSLAASPHSRSVSRAPSYFKRGLSAMYG